MAIITNENGIQEDDSIKQDNRIFEYRIRQEWMRLVRDVIVKSCYSKAKPPYYKGRQVVPSSYLGEIKHNDRSIGDWNTPIKGSVLYDLIVEFTKEMMKVGTFSYTRYLKVRTAQNKNIEEFDGSMSGSCIFSDSYKKSLNHIPSENVSIYANITADSINDLITNSLQAYKNSTKPTYNNTESVCYDDRCYCGCNSAPCGCNGYVCVTCSTNDSSGGGTTTPDPPQTPHTTAETTTETVPPPTCSCQTQYLSHTVQSAQTTMKAAESLKNGTGSLTDVVKAAQQTKANDGKVTDCMGGGTYGSGR